MIVDPLYPIVAAGAARTAGDGDGQRGATPPAAAAASSGALVKAERGTRGTSGSRWPRSSTMARVRLPAGRARSVPKRPVVVVAYGGGVGEEEEGLGARRMRGRRKHTLTAAQRTLPRVKPMQSRRAHLLLARVGLHPVA